MPRAFLSIVIGALLGGAAVYVSQHVGARKEPESLGSSLPSLSSNPSISYPDTETGRDQANQGNLADERATSASVASELGTLMARVAAEPEAVLAELRGLSPPALQRRTALEVLEALGNDDAGLTRVAAMLPEINRVSFQIDALAARAQRDASSALRSALALDSSMARRLAVPRIAAAAAKLDPQDALAQASLIGNRELSALYVAGVAEAWATSDAAAALDYLVTAVPSALPAQTAAQALDAIAAIDHRLLLDNLESFSPALRPAARRAAILAMVERDAPSAIAAVASLGPGRERSELEAAVAERYGLENPEAAIEWAKTLPESQSAIEAVLRSAASTDYDAAVDLALTALETEPIWPAFALVESGAGDFSQVADRLLASDLSDVDSKMQQLMVRWPQIDAQAALEWAVDHAERLERTWLGRLTVDGGREYPELAIGALDSIPLDLRGDWIAGVAGGVAATDADRALAFLEQHRGQPGYDDGLESVAISIASSDPAGAARLVDRTGARAAGRVAFAWAQQDPRAAAEWAAGLDDPDLRMDAIMNLGANWSRTDPDAAIAWLIDLPEDIGRDAGLQAALQIATATTGSLDLRALDAIGDDRMRGQAVVSAATVLARSDPDEARRLVERHVEDADLRQQALQRIAEQARGTDAVNLLSSSVDFPR